MAKRVTIADVAEKAGVSIATVDRVLNGRHRVKDHTAQQVYEAATELGYYAANVIRARLQTNIPQYRIGILLQRPKQAFYQELARIIQSYAKQQTQYRILLELEFLEAQIPSDVANQLRNMARRVQAIAMTTIDHAITNNAIAELKAQGIPIFSLLSDFAHGATEGYLGVDNRKVGRTAAWLISHTAKQAGKIAIFVGSHRFLGHEMREIGFRTYIREHAPQFEVIDTLLNLEERNITHEATLDILERYPDLVGMYVAGGGMEGAISALRENNKAGQLIAVCNELTPESKTALVDNIITMVVATPLEQLVQELFRQMIHAIEQGTSENTTHTFLPFQIYFSENI